MPIYTYQCEVGHQFEELRKVEDRHGELDCPKCGRSSGLVITPVHFDWNIGVDRDFPTMASKWDRIQRGKSKGKIWDSNNNRFGGEYEKSR